jgi:hypothetical protein
MTAAPDQLTPLMGPVARILLGEPNARLSNKGELRFGNQGSLSVDLTKGTWYDHEHQYGGGVLDLIEARTGARAVERFKWLQQHGLWSDNKPNGRGEARRLGRELAHYDYTDEAGNLLFQVVRFEPKDFRQRVRDETKMSGWSWTVKGVRQVPYRLPDVIEAIASEQLVVIVEGEKDVDNLWQIGIAATTNAGGVGKWADSLNVHFRGAEVVILNDNDQAGREQWPPSTRSRSCS